VTTFFLVLPFAERGAGDAAYYVLNLSYAGMLLLRDSHGSKIALGGILWTLSGLTVELKSVFVALNSVYLNVLLLRGSFYAVLDFFFSIFFELCLAVE